ncbi:BgTH12-06818 [Blumeria graminis f. sp. triticale]|uniref:BgTH12-06818 n=1 Tax=Blumeria graminis f. sp. triticale TaxID=1689686 RepID=A0A9W4DSM4_BLUGR|nr:BgTH12-06818 [Blumeria graminis f. sp. triticale]
MPPGRRKKPVAIALPAKTITHTAKRVRLKSSLTSAREEAILAASSESHHSPAESILIDTEDESMDSGSENDYLPDPLHMLEPATWAPNLQATRVLKKNSGTGLSSSIHASSKSQPIQTPKVDTKSTPSPTRESAPVIHQPSAATTNDIATSSLAWQNAGAQHLRALPPAIAADLKAIVKRSAARVIAGLPVFEQSTTVTN